jgi:predicted Rossmann fold flavoprotein
MDAGSQVMLHIDLKPGLSMEQLNNRILRDFEQSGNAQIKNVLNKLLPKKMIPVIISLSGISADKQVNHVTREERSQLQNKIKNFPLSLTALRGYSEAVVTRGGICVKEINPKTMESKKVRGVYYVGEVLDLDALTGGFNLQIAWSTGYMAGNSV